MSCDPSRFGIDANGCLAGTTLPVVTAGEPQGGDVEGEEGRWRAAEARRRDAALIDSCLSAMPGAVVPESASIAEILEATEALLFEREDGAKRTGDLLAAIASRVPHETRARLKGGERRKQVAEDQADG